MNNGTAGTGTSTGMGTGTGQPVPTGAGTHLALLSGCDQQQAARFAGIESFALLSWHIRYNVTILQPLVFTAFLASCINQRNGMRGQVTLDR